MMKYSVCNELFGDMDLAEACAVMRRCGFSGVEFAPFTIFGDFSEGAIRGGLDRAREVLDGEGLAFAGFHWLLAKPDGLHFASLDPSVRKKTRDHLARLLDAAAELGGGKLILGSPRQRGGFPGRDRKEAEGFLVETLAGLAPHALSCRSEILIEQLSPEQTDVINTMEEAAGAVDRIGAAGVSGMFDFHNAVSEKYSWRELVERYYPYIKHVHVNETDGRAPGTGVSDYGPAWEVLKAGGYDGWMSIEIFEVPAEPGAMLDDAMRLFRRLEK